MFSVGQSFLGWSLSLGKNGVGGLSPRQDTMSFVVLFVQLGCRSSGVHKVTSRTDIASLPGHHFEGDMECKPLLEVGDDYIVK